MAGKESLSQAISRMRRQGYSDAAIAGQIRRWHRDWAPGRATVEVADTPGAKVPRTTYPAKSGTGAMARVATPPPAHRQSAADRKAGTVWAAEQSLGPWDLPRSAPSRQAPFRKGAAPQHALTPEQRYRLALGAPVVPRARQELARSADPTTRWHIAHPGQLTDAERARLPGKAPGRRFLDFAANFEKNYAKAYVKSGGNPLAVFDPLLKTAAQVGGHAAKRGGEGLAAGIASPFIDLLGDPRVTRRAWQEPLDPQKVRQVHEQAIVPSDLAYGTFKAIVPGGAGSVASFRHPLEATKAIFKEGVDILSGTVQMGGAALAISQMPNDEQRRHTVDQMVHAMVDDLKKRYGPDTSISEVFTDAQREPLIYGLNSLGAASPLSKAAVISKMLASGDMTVGELSTAFRAAEVPERARVLTMRQPGGTGLGIEVPWSPSPLTRVRQRGYDAASRAIEASPARKAPLIGRASESRRAARQYRKQAQRSGRRMTAKVLVLAHEIDRDIGRDTLLRRDQPLQTLLATLQQKPEGITDDRWIEAVMGDLRQMLEGRAIESPERVTPAMKQLMKTAKTYEQKAALARDTRRVHVMKDIGRQETKLARALERNQQERADIHDELLNLDDNPDLSAAEKEQTRTQLIEDLRSHDTAGKVIRDELKDISVDRPPIEHAKRDKARETMESIPWFQRERERATKQHANDLAAARKRVTTAEASVTSSKSASGRRLAESRVQRAEDNLSTVEQRGAHDPVEDMLAIGDARARVWARRTGEDPANWWAKLDVRKVRPEEIPADAFNQVDFSLRRDVTPETAAENLRRVGPHTLKEDFTLPDGTVLRAGTELPAGDLYDPTKGLHQNKKVFRTIRGQRVQVLGPITPREWVKRIRAVVPDAAERNALAKWYEEVATTFERFFGDDAEALLRGFTVSQANASPSSGLQATLRVFDKLMAGEEIGDREISAVVKSIEQAVKGGHVSRGLAAKLHDFADSIQGKETRTWMGDDPRGGAPTANDVHAIRDLGYVDKKLAARLRSPESDALFTTGIKDFVIDSGGSPGTHQYERMTEMYKEITDHLNEIGFDGRKDWKPAEVQALGWSAIQRVHGADPENLISAVKSNTRRINIDPVGAGSDFTYDEATSIAQQMAGPLREMIDETDGVYMDGSVEVGVTGTAGKARPQLQIDVLGSPEKAHDLVVRFSEIMGDGTVDATRVSSSTGSKPTLFIAHEALSDPSVMGALHDALYAVDKKEFPSFRSTELDGVPAVAIRIRGKSITKNSYDDRWAALEDKVNEAVTQALGEVEYDGHLDNTQTITKEWKSGSGKGKSEGVSGASGRPALDGPLAAEARDRYRSALDAARAGRRGRSDVRFTEASSPEHLSSFVEAAQRNPRSEFLTKYTPEDLVDHRVFLSEDGHTGYAISPEGDLTNVFRNPEGESGSGAAAVDHAIANGARTLDAFDGFLPDLYREKGFVEHKRMAWDDAYAPDGWDYERNGRPDIVFMQREAKTGDAPVLAQTRRQDLLGASHWLDTPDGQRVIYLTENADATTVLHELVGHATDEMRAYHPHDFARVEDEIGKPYADWERADHEQFATWVERYFKDGLAPTPELVPVMARIKTWVRTIYQGMLRSLGPRIPLATKTMLDAYFGAFDDENAFRVAAAMHKAPVMKADEEAHMGGAAVVAAKRLTTARRRNETAAYNRSLDAMVERLDELRNMDSWTPEQEAEYIDLYGKSLAKAAHDDMRGDIREKRLREKLGDLEKALGRVPGNRRFEGARMAMREMSDLREDTLRTVFGEDYDATFEARADLLPDWLHQQGLLPEDYEPGTAGYFPHQIGAENRRGVAAPAQSLTRRVVGQMQKADLRLHKMNQLIAWQRGDWTVDPQVLTDAALRAASYAHVKEIKDTLFDMGRPLTREEMLGIKKLPDDAYIVNPHGTPISPHLRASMDRKTQTLDAQNAVEGVEGGANETMQASLEAYLHNSFFDPGELPKDFNIVEGMRVVDKKLVHEILRPLAGSGGSVGRIADWANTLARWSLIYGNVPGYAIANSVGNTGFLLAQQGWRLPESIAAARKLFGNDRLATMIDAEAGELPSFAAISRGREFSQRFARGEAVALNKISYVDRMPRRIAWVYQARKAGYKTEDDMWRLLKGADAKTRSDRERVADLTAQHMVDFDRLTPFEKQRLTRVFFVYPWVRAATSWPFWYASHFPERTAGAANLALPFEQRRKEMLRGAGATAVAPPWYEQMYPVSRSGAPGHERAVVINAGPISPTGTALQQLETFRDTLASLFGEKPTSLTSRLVDSLAPAWRDSISATTLATPSGQAQSLHDMLGGLALDIVPGWRLAQAMRDPSASPKVFTHDDAMTRAEHTFLRLAPAEISIPRLNAQAAVRGTPNATDEIRKAEKQIAKDWEKIPAERGRGVDQRVVKAATIAVLFKQYGTEMQRKKKSDRQWDPKKLESGAYQTLPDLSPYEQSRLIFKVVRNVYPAYPLKDPALWLGEKTHDGKPVSPNSVRGKEYLKRYKDHVYSYFTGPASRVRHAAKEQQLREDLVLEEGLSASG